MKLLDELQSGFIATITGVNILKTHILE